MKIDMNIIAVLIAAMLGWGSQFLTDAHGKHEEQTMTSLKVSQLSEQMSQISEKMDKLSQELNQVKISIARYQP